MSRTLFSIVFLIGAVIVGVFYAWPQWTQLSLTSRAIDDLTAVSKQYDDLIKNRDALLASINSISKENLDRLDQALPLGSNASEFLVALESYTASNGVALKRVDLASPAEEAKPSAAVPSASAPRPVQNPVPFQPKPQSNPQPAIFASASSGGEKAIGELPFSIGVSGSYSALKKFLGGLERNIRLIDVSEISFSSPAKADESMDVTLRAKTYYQ